MQKSAKIIARNKKAKFSYEIIEKIEAGIVLKGSEVKAIRDNKVAIENAYAILKKNEIWMINLHIDTKKFDISFDISELTRPKKILLNKKEINKISIKIKNNGYTIVPIDLHFNTKGFVKVLLGISKGRKKQDLREYKKKQDWKRDKQKLGSQ
ncbi:MAG: SsrA-binding protein SmpB [Alphaproteobacteria bacterium]